MSSTPFSVKLATFMVDNPIKVIFASILVFFAVAFGAKNLEFSTNYRVFFSGENPQLQAFDELERVYSKTDNIMFVVKPNEGDVFQPKVLNLIKELTEASWKLPYAQRVDSITNFQNTYADEDELIVEDLVEADPATLSAEQLARIKNIALNEPLLVGQVISSDAKTTGVNVTVNLTREDPFEVPKTVAVARELMANMKEKYPGIEIRPSGMVFMNNAFMESSMQDMQKLIPIMYLVLLVTMVIFLRSFLATIATTFVIIFSAMTAMGFGGWMGFPMTPPTSTVPTIVLTLAIADSIHIIVSMLKSMQLKGSTRREAIIESLRINLQPVFLTTLTTCIGFLALNFSEVPPFWHLGNMTAFGITMAFVFSVTFLPACLMILPIKVKKIENEKRTSMDIFSDFIIAKRNYILVCSVILVGFLGTMVTKIQINDQFVQYFDHSIDFRNDSEFMLDNLTGLYNVEYSIKSGETSGISKPEYLNIISNYVDWLRAQPEVMHVYSITDIFKRLNKNMHADDEAWHKLPEQEDMSAQYLLLYELSLPYGLDLNDRIDIKKSSNRVSVVLKDLSTNEIRSFKDRSENWLVKNAPEVMHTEATSPVVMFAFISQRNIQSMLTGNLISLILISISIMIALRSIKIGLFSLVPNLVPIVIGYGLWGIFIGEINMAVAIAAAVSLGIIVDDSVHFLSKYLRARREENYDSADAVRYAFNTVGPALVITTFVLCAGFGILAKSAFQVNEYLGLLTVFVIASALAADFFLLPTLLMKIEGAKNIKPRRLSMNGAAALIAIMLILTSIPTDVSAKNAQEILASGTAKEQGEAIAVEFDERDTGFGDQVSTMKMVMRNAFDDHTSRSMTTRIFEIADRSLGDKTLIVFNDPRDVKGTALLSHAQILDPDDQWLFLPSLKRVKRISSKNKSGPFVGSEFAYEDITSNEIGKYSWEYLENGPCPNDTSLECFKLDTRPKYEHSGYTKRIVWMDINEFRLQQIDYYDRKDELIKVQTYNDYRKYLDRFWRAHSWEMKNVQTGKSTSLIYDEYKFENNLSEKDFTKAVLKRVK